MPTGIYQIYAVVLADRIAEVVEREGLILANLAGRTKKKGMGTMDNVYILNYLVNRQMGKKGGKLMALFIDLKAAFDFVDKRILVEIMKKRGIRVGLRG